MHILQTKKALSTGNAFFIARCFTELGSPRIQACFAG
jgi:hypothetical protein